MKQSMSYGHRTQELTPGQQEQANKMREYHFKKRLERGARPNRDFRRDEHGE
jgi:hypothetical protein